MITNGYAIGLMYLQYYTFYHYNILLTYWKKYLLQNTIPCYTGHSLDILYVWSLLTAPRNHNKLLAYIIRMRVNITHYDDVHTLIQFPKQVSQNVSCYRVTKVTRLYVHVHSPPTHTQKESATKNLHSTLES